MSERPKIWFYSHNGAQQGPISSQDLMAMAKSGAITTETLIWKEGLKEWVRADRIKGLFTPAPPMLPRENAYNNPPPVNHRHSTAQHAMHGQPPGFSDAIKICLKKYVDFTGRASRSEYWYFNLFVCMLFVASVFISVFFWLVSDTVDEDALDLLSSTLSIIVLLAISLPNLAVTTRRMHDINRSGWSTLLCFIPMVGPIIVMTLALQKSDPNTNKYGPPPF